MIVQQRWERLRELAVHQHGLVTRQQALAAGFSASAVSSAANREGWRRLAPGVFVLPGVEVTALRRVVAATLRHPAASASSWTAL